MKIILYFSLLGLFVAISGCKKEIKYTDSYSYYYRMAGFTGVGNNALYDTLYSKTEVKVFSKEVDFWADKNEISKGYMDFNGEYYFIKDSEIPHSEVVGYWVKISYKDMNNYRDISSYHINQDDNSIYGGSLKNDKTHKREFKYYGVGYPRTTPTKLQLRVYNNGMPVEGAKVYLYDSETNFNNKYNSDFFLFSHFTNYADFDNIRKVYHSYELTDAQGLANMSNLEPRTYWFRIEKDGKTNAASKIFTGEALPNDVNVTTILDIAIN